MHHSLRFQNQLITQIFSPPTSIAILGINVETISERDSWLANSQSLPDLCERIRYETVLILNDLRDHQDVHQALRQAIQQDNSVWVRSAALGSFWNLGFRNAYVKELSKESDPQKQIQLIDDLMASSKMMRSAGTDIAPLRFYPLQAHEINELRQLKGTTTNANIQAGLKTLLLGEADKTILFYSDASAGQLNKPLILNTIRVLFPEFNDSHIERLKVLANQEKEYKMSRIISDIIEDYYAYKSSSGEPVGSQQIVEAKLNNTDPIGYLYLIRSQRDEAAELTPKEGQTYDLKLYDPLTQKISLISEVSLPYDVSLFDFRSIQYGAGKLFFHISIPYVSPTHKIFMLDLKSNAGKYIIEPWENASNRVIPSYLVRGDDLFFLSCDFLKGKSNEIINDGFDGCQLQQISLRENLGTPAKTLLDLQGVFKRDDTVKYIVQYSPEKNWLILNEYTAPNSYVEKGISYYYGISLGTLKVHELSEQEMQTVFAEFKEIKKGQCEQLTEGSGFFEKERGDDVFPPQI